MGGRDKTTHSSFDHFPLEEKVDADLMTAEDMGGVNVHNKYGNEDE